MGIDRKQLKDTSIFEIAEQQIKIELNQFRQFVEKTSGELNHKKGNANLNIEPLKDLEKEYENISIDEFRKYDREFSKLTYNPMLLFIYGFLEHQLKRLCEFDSRKGLSDITVSDLAGRNYIEKSKIYFEKVAVITLHELEKEWERINIVQQIRNLIAHNNSNLFKEGAKGYNQQLFKFLQEESNIDFDEKLGDFVINKKFILEVLDLIEKYLIAVSRKISNVKVVAKNIYFSFNMEKWGQEKCERLLRDVIDGLDMLDSYEKRSDEYKLTDTLANIRGLLEVMPCNLTKLLSFFSNGDWQNSDRDFIINERLEGLEKLQSIYEE
jgi:hypothetical protein